MEAKIAVTYENGQVFQHFGHTAHFRIYEVKDGQAVSAQTVETGGSGHGALAGFLKERNVDTLICGGIGGGARNALGEAGIRIYGGVSGDADQAVEALLAGRLAYDPEAACSHHEEAGHDGNCGGHDDGCGEHGAHGSCGDHKTNGDCGGYKARG